MKEKRKHQGTGVTKQRVISQMTAAILTAAFEDLNSQNIIAYEDFWCCQSCGCAALKQETIARIVEGEPIIGIAFYHAQDAEDMKRIGKFCIAFSGVAAPDAQIAQTVVDTLTRYGVQASWCGDTSKRVMVSLTKVTASELRHSWCKMMMGFRQS